MRVYYSIFILSLFIFSCQQKDSNVFNHFLNEYDLTGQIVHDTNYYRDGTINLYDSLLIITATPENLNTIHIYNKNSFNYICSTGLVGKGPGEINNPGHATIDKDSGIIWNMDYSLKCLWKFNIEDVLSKKGVYLPQKNIPIPNNQIIINFKYAKNDLFAFPNVNQNTLISFFNKEGKVLETLNIPNNLKIYTEEIDFYSRMLTSNYFFEKHPMENKYVLSYRFADALGFINNNGNVLGKIYGPQKMIQIPDNNNNAQFISYVGIKVHKNLIFSSYSGKKRFIEKNGDIFPIEPKKIMIFNWDMIPLIQLNLNHSVSSFEIDMENRRIITFSPDVGKIVYYNLNRSILEKMTNE